MIHGAVLNAKSRRTYDKICVTKINTCVYYSWSLRVFTTSCSSTSVLIWELSFTASCLSTSVLIWELCFTTSCSSTSVIIWELCFTTSCSSTSARVWGCVLQQAVHPLLHVYGSCVLLTRGKYVHDLIFTL